MDATRIPLQYTSYEWYSHTLTINTSYEFYSHTLTIHTSYEFYSQTLSIHISYKFYSHILTTDVSYESHSHIKRCNPGSLLLITKNINHWSFEWTLPSKQRVCPVASHHGLHFQSFDNFNSTISNSVPFVYSRLLNFLLCSISEQFLYFLIHEVKSQVTGKKLISFLYKVQREGNDYARANIKV